jgi:hypothetical protein
MKILVCGPRDWTDDEAVYKVLDEHNHPSLSLITGGAAGVDWHAWQWARKRIIPVTLFLADWDKHGRGAGPIRNQKMLDAGPDRVIAFAYGPELTRGTRDMVRRAAKAGIPVYIAYSERGY